MWPLRDAWIKAAVEHKTLTITYRSARTKGETTVREVEPDYYGYDVDGRNRGCWGFCRLRKENRCFYDDSVLTWEYSGNDFSPNSLGRWQELVPVYKKEKLDQKKW